MVRKVVEMDLDFMGYIPNSPQDLQAMHKQACNNDSITISTWKDIWINNMRENYAKYGPFHKKSITEDYKAFKWMPVIVAGSGPSLKENIGQLKVASDKGFPIVSCLHNYHFFIDNGIKAHAYVSLDAGNVVIEEIAEGGQKTLDEYLETTKENKLYSFICSPPKLHDLWQGELLFFNSPIPDNSVMEETKDLGPFSAWVSSGGNVLGAATYISKAFLGANPICFVGADFSFSYTKNFHGWNSKYDKDIGHAIRATDIYGNSRLTWQSYYNFKVWFDWLAQQLKGTWINCTEGGILGAYPTGNIQQITQMYLEDFVRMYTYYEDLQDQVDHPDKECKKILF